MMRGRKVIEQLLGLSPKAVGGILQAPVGMFEAARNKPDMRSTMRRRVQLEDAFDKHVDDIKPGARVEFGLAMPTPQGNLPARLNEVAQDSTAFAGSTAPGKEPGISINPNSDRSLFAHELGHLASQQTDVGRLVANLRYNPNLQKALLGSLAIIPGAAAVFEAGDDDLDSSLAIAAATALPTMIDEGLATKHGLAIMDKAGLRASMGQRGKLAGGLMSYLAPALMTGLGGNIVGNLLDSNE